MKRRAFFGLMGGAVAAGPGMVKKAAAQTMADLAVDPFGGNVIGLQSSTANMQTGAAGNLFGPVGHVAELQGQLAKLTGLSAKDKRERAAQTHVGALDPDIACLGSVALGAKVAMQRVRNYERHLAQERTWLQRRIDDLLGVADSD